MMNDPISNALTTILNAEKKGKSTCIIKPFSNLVVSILELMKTNGYITEFNSASNARGG